MLGLSPLHLLVVLLIVILLFGPKRLPDLGAGLGKAISNFKRSYREGSTIDVTPEEQASNAKDNEKKS